MDSLASVFLQMLPFAQLVGVEVVEMGPAGSVLRLPDDPRLGNHVGTQHAAALFTVAEVASGAAVVGAFAERLLDVTALAKSAEIRYLKPARGVIVARARIAEDQPALWARLEETGKSEFAVEVDLRDPADQKVAETTVQWHLRRPRA